MKKLSIPFDSSKITEAVYFIQESLRTFGVRDQQLKETVLISEELIVKLFEKEEGNAHDEHDTIDINVSRHLTGRIVNIGYNGSILKLNNMNEDIGGSILKYYSDRIACRYGAGRNRISVTADNTYTGFLKKSCISILLSVIVSLALIYVAPPEVASEVQGALDYVTQLFCNALSLIAPLVTLFSIIMAISLIARTAGGYSWTKRMLAGILSTSIFSVVIGAVLATVACSIFFEKTVSSTEIAGELFTQTLIDSTKHLVPSSIFEVLSGSNALQLVLVAVICGIAVATAGNNNVHVDNVFSAIYSFFCKLLALLYSVLPIIIFTSFTLLIMSLRVNFVRYLLLYVGLFLFGGVLIVAVYVLSLKKNGLNTKKFFGVFRKNAETLFNIGSVVEAEPYLIRVCSRQLKISKELLEESVPIISNLNMDGNCLVVSFMTACSIYYNFNTSPSLLGIICIATLIIIICTGSPAQPGTTIIALAIISPILGVQNTLVQMALIMDAFAGSLIALLTSFTTMAITSVEAKKEGYIDGDFNKLRD